MTRKKKLQVEKTPNIPRGGEHRADLVTPKDQAVRTRDIRLDQAGTEIPSEEPVLLRVGRKLIGDPELIREKIRQLRAMDASGIEFETFEEADDFNVDDDYGDFTSQWEIPADTDQAVQDYLHYRRTGELPEDVATRLAKHAPAGHTSAPPPQDPRSPASAPASSGPPAQPGNTPGS